MKKRHKNLSPYLLYIYIYIKFIHIHKVGGKYLFLSLSQLVHIIIIIRRSCFFQKTHIDYFLVKHLYIIPLYGNRLHWLGHVRIEDKVKVLWEVQRILFRVIPLRSSRTVLHHDRLALTRTMREEALKTEANWRRCLNIHIISVWGSVFSLSCLLAMGRRAQLGRNIMLEYYWLEHLRIMGIILRVSSLLRVM